MANTNLRATYIQTYTNIQKIHQYGLAFAALINTRIFRKDSKSFQVPFMLRLVQLYER